MIEVTLSDESWFVTLLEDIGGIRLYQYIDKAKIADPRYGAAVCLSATLDMMEDTIYHENSWSTNQSTLNSVFTMPSGGDRSIGFIRDQNKLFMAIKAKTPHGWATTGRILSKDRLYKRVMRRFAKLARCGELGNAQPFDYFEDIKQPPQPLPQPIQPIQQPQPWIAPPWTPIPPPTWTPIAPSTTPCPPWDWNSTITCTPLQQTTNAKTSFHTVNWSISEAG